MSILDDLFFSRMRYRAYYKLPASALFDTISGGNHDKTFKEIVYIYRPVARIFFGGVRSLERKGYFCQRFSVAVKSIYNQLRHDNSLLL